LHFLTPVLTWAGIQWGGQTFSARDGVKRVFPSVSPRIFLFKKNLFRFSGKTGPELGANGPPASFFFPAFPRRRGGKKRQGRNPQGPMIWTTKKPGPKGTKGKRGGGVRSFPIWGKGRGAKKQRGRATKGARLEGGGQRKRKKN